MLKPEAHQEINGLKSRHSYSIYWTKKCWSNGVSYNYHGFDWLWWYWLIWFLADAMQFYWWSLLSSIRRRYGVFDTKTVICILYDYLKKIECEKAWSLLWLVIDCFWICTVTISWSLKVSFLCLDVCYFYLKIRWWIFLHIHEWERERESMMQWMEMN